MATILHVICQRCGTEDTELDGPTFSGYQPRCEECGQSRLISLFSPEARAPGVKYTETWAAEQAGTCSCGGRFSADAPIRCSVCWSADVRTTEFGHAD